MRIAELLRLPCGATLPNRLAKGAMTEGLATANGVPTPALDRLYRCWSEGGAGMHLTGNVIIDRDHLERPGNVIIDRPPSAEMKAALASWAAFTRPEALTSPRQDLPFVVEELPCLQAG